MMGTYVGVCDRDWNIFDMRILLDHSDSSTMFWQTLVGICLDTNGSSEGLIVNDVVRMTRRFRVCTVDDVRGSAG